MVNGENTSKSQKQRRFELQMFPNGKFLQALDGIHRIRGATARRVRLYQRTINSILNTNN